MSTDTLDKRNPNVGVKMLNLCPLPGSFLATQRQNQQPSTHSRVEPSSQPVAPGNNLNPSKK